MLPIGNTVRHDQVMVITYDKFYMIIISAMFFRTRYQHRFSVIGGEGTVYIFRA